MEPMILFNPWGLLGLLAIPAILAIHLFRRRFRPHPVTGLFLYGANVRTVAAGRKRQRLLWRTSLLMELLAALALTWYLSDPHLDDRQQSRHLVVVLDSRWRVGATTPTGSVDTALRTVVGSRIATLSPEDRVTLITSGTTATVACGPAAPPREALTVLEHWRPEQAWHELDGALTLARSIADNGAAVLLASDRMPSVVPPGISVLTTGQALTTSGVVDARWYADADGRRVVARVLAQGGAMTRRLELRRGGQVMADQDLHLEDGVPATMAFPLTGDAGEDLTLALSGSDPLTPDDQIALIAPPPAVVLVRLATSEMQTAVVKRAVSAIHGVRMVADPLTPVHVLIGGDQPAHAGAWTLHLVTGDAAPVLGPFLARRGHPMLGGLDFTGVLWTGGLKGTLLSGTAAPLVEAGSTILVSEERRGRDRDLTLHVDLATSGLTNHPVWPALIANVIAARRAALPGIRQPNLLPGQDQVVVLPPGATGLRVIAPDGHEAHLTADSEGTVLLPGQGKAGIHRLVLDGSEDTWQRLNVLPCDARMGDLRAAAGSMRDGESDGRSLVERRRPMLAHLLPILLAAIAAIAGWFAFGREEGRAP